MTTNRVAVVTGTGHGMGSTIAETLRKSGHTVHGVDRDEAGSGAQADDSGGQDQGDR